MSKGRPALPRWDVKPNDDSHPGILVRAATGQEAIDRARGIMKDWKSPSFLLTATERYNY